MRECWAAAAPLVIFGLYGPLAAKIQKSVSLSMVSIEIPSVDALDASSIYDCHAHTRAHVTVI